jgi:hypothetical protein
MIQIYRQQLFPMLSTHDFSDDGRAQTETYPKKHCTRMCSVQRLSFVTYHISRTLGSRNHLSKCSLCYCAHRQHAYFLYVCHQYTSTPQNVGHQPGMFLFWIIANAGLVSSRAWGRLSGPLGEPPGRHYEHPAPNAARFGSNAILPL